MSASSITQLRLGLSFLCLLVSFTLLSDHSSLRLFKRLELLAYDWRMVFTAPQSKLDERIVIVDIDERSLLAEGQWPWPRTRLAELITLLHSEYQASAIGIDILFPEASHPRTEDTALGEAARQSNTILAQLFQIEPGSRSLSVGSLTISDQPPNEAAPIAQGFIGNTPALASSNTAGHISIDVDLDGKVRRLPALVRWQDNAYNTLSLTMVRRLFLLPAFQLETGTKALDANHYLLSAPFRIPANSDGRLLIPFRGDAGLYHYVPATDVLNGRAEIDILRDRIVLIGSSATGLFDLIATPWSKNYPGVEVHANVISALLDNRLITEPDNQTLLILATCTLAFFTTLLSYRHLNIVLSSMVPALLGLTWIVFNFTSWQYYQLALPITPPLLLLLALALVNSPALALQATLQRQSLYRHFQDYVPATVVEQLFKEKDHNSIGPERREMTVLFMDIRGFTSIAENLSPLKLSELMNEVLSPVTRIIHEQGGTIDKYMGDAVMAFWGAPLEQPDHAERAVNTAIQIYAAIDELNRSLSEKSLPTIRIGIGVNTGVMTVGNMGSDFRVSYTVIGDAVNIAARLESLTKEYTPDILLGNGTMEALDGSIKCTHIGEIVLKGRSQPVHIYTPDSGKLSA